MQMSEGIYGNVISDVHFPRVTAVDGEHFPVLGCYNQIFSIDKDAGKRVLISICHDLMREYTKFLVKGLDSW